uniref:C-C motif chemokine n=2 Tax=Equus TaxID=9789 RepID=F6PYR5_HORSE
MSPYLTHFQKFPEKSQGPNSRNEARVRPRAQTGVRWSRIIASHQGMGLRNETGGDTKTVLPPSHVSPFLVCFSQIESTMEGHQVQVSIIKAGFHSPADCCLSYTSQKIRCELMTSYFETSSGCSRPGVIFLTKKGKFVCADPFNKRVRNCMTYLKPSDTKDLKKMNLA